MASALTSSVAISGKTFLGKAVEAKKSSVKACAATKITAEAKSVSLNTSRRAALGLAAGAAALTQVPKSEAAYGDSANVFGKTTNDTGYIPYVGDGYSLLLPSKWNPSKERPFPGVDVRYEDNFDLVNSLIVLVADAGGKNSIKDFGSQEDFLKKISYLFGTQSFVGESQDGGFAKGQVQLASLLAQKSVEKGGKQYYTYEVLCRTADGDEGGRNQLISAVVSKGKLYILKVQAGNKRYTKGVDRDVKGTLESFTVA